ncbi:tail fiber protein [Sphingomonas sp. AOB5]|uniref:phage tail protein n=1 Tax=Sphingomonas sp. AOB5 TaxID=3034017 RepID=UPI0023F8EB6B|nr:tail fiber protein [Sphingomonas sp. AOB5]MDF7775189.1 tail fiber protein [Sphingomonas sp. AOB5]
MLAAYIGEIRLFPYSRIPQNWLPCDGRLLKANENNALYTLLGNLYGGNYPQFALPDLRSRSIMGRTMNEDQPTAGGQSLSIGAKGGVETVMLMVDQIPAHRHNWFCEVGVANAPNPRNNRFCEVGTAAGPLYTSDLSPVTLAAATLGNTGNGMPHDNMQPYLAMSYCICVQGSYPPNEPASADGTNPCPWSISMSDWFLGEIRPFAGNFAPVSWHLCDGSLMSIRQFPSLFAMLGRTYGGDGNNNFGLPDLRGITVVGAIIDGDPAPGLTPRALGARGGEEHVRLTTATMPIHTHAVRASGSPGSSSVPLQCYPGASQTGNTFYLSGGAPNPVDAPLDRETIMQVGLGAPHENRMPSLAISYIIAMNGKFPKL